MKDFFVVIPARYASVRLPGKPLIDIAGKTMIEHVYDRARQSSARETIIATDDRRIAEVAESFGARVCMTATEHRSGSERIAEVCDEMGWADNTIVVNLQGDEPTMPAELIDQCAELLSDTQAEIATLASPFESMDDFESPNVVKVLLNDRGEAIYFSRATIPFARSPDSAGEAMRAARQHHGIYAYRVGALRAFVTAPASDIEQIEQLEQLRALSIGLRIRVAMPRVRPGAGVDTEDDIERVAQALK